MKLEYVGGGYFREAGLAKGVKARVIHGAEVAAILNKAISVVLTDSQGHGNPVDAYDAVSPEIEELGKLFSQAGLDINDPS